MPLDGNNQFFDPAIPAMRPMVLKYIEDVTELGKTISDLISLSLRLEKSYIRRHYLQPEPAALFRCFKYSINAASGLPNANRQDHGTGKHTG
ncbi:hypothetical protein FRB97_003632, partial [Tulasnella sp. 331]